MVVAVAVAEPAQLPKPLVLAAVVVVAEHSPESQYQRPPWAQLKPSPLARLEPWGLEAHLATAYPAESVEHHPSVPIYPPLAVAAAVAARANGQKEEAVAELVARVFQVTVRQEEPVDRPAHLPRPLLRDKVLRRMHRPSAAVPNSAAAAAVEVTQTRGA